MFFLNFLSINSSPQVKYTINMVNMWEWHLQNFLYPVFELFQIYQTLIMEFHLHLLQRINWWFSCRHNNDDILLHWHPNGGGKCLIIDLFNYKLHNLSICIGDNIRNDDKDLLHIGHGHGTSQCCDFVYN